MIVDTSVWSLALRRRNSGNTPVAEILAELIGEGRALILGPIRQELLSGIASEKHYTTLRQSLEAFPDLPLEAADYEEAAVCFNHCRARGIQGSNTDFLICAAAIRRKLGILTTDDDFTHFTRVLPIRLYPIPPGG